MEISKHLMKVVLLLAKIKRVKQKMLLSKLIHTKEQQIPQLQLGLWLLVLNTQKELKK